MSVLSVIGVTANVTRPSRNRLLAATVVDEIVDRTPSLGRLIDLADLGGALLAAATPAQLDEAGRELVEAVEGADLLVVSTPIHRGGYPGLFKHLFDLVDPEALTGKPVILTATGTGALGATVAEYQLRRLFDFFGARMTPTLVYATDIDLSERRIVSPPLARKIKLAVQEALDLFEDGRPEALPPLDRGVLRVMASGIA